MTPENAAAERDLSMKPFIRRHEQVFILIGALIIGVGFFVREYFLATDREELTSLMSAQTEYMIEANFYTTIGAVQEVRDQSSRDCDELGTAPNQQSDAVKTMVEDCFDYSVQSLDRIAALIGAFPEKPPVLVAQRAALQAEYEALLADYDSGRLPRAGADGSAKSFGGLPELYVKIRRFESDVVKQGYGQRDGLRDRIRRLTLVSYALFLLGWTVGLLAKLFKVGDGTAAIE